MWKNIKYFFYKLKFLGIMNSPLKPLKLWLDWGDIKHGTPYFYPRKWVKSEGKTSMHAVPVKWLWFDLISLGWKPKWDDLRFEWSPAISIVILKKQLFILFTPKLDSPMLTGIYWETWLYYDQRTDKSKPKEERLLQLFGEYSCTWISSKDGVRITTDYFPMILRNKYIKLYKEWQTSQSASEMDVQ